MPLFGIEVSKYNGNINHAAAKNAGVRFATVAASKGEVTDSRFSQNAAGFHAVGVPVGACHTLMATSVHEALSEARFFVGTLKPLCDKLTLPIVCRTDAGVSTPHMAQVFIKYVADAGFDVCALSDGINVVLDGKLAVRTHTREGQLIGVAGEFACAFAYAPITRLIIKSRTEITDDTLDYIERCERGEYILGRLADMMVARTINPLRNPSYEHVAALLRLCCKLSVDDCAHLCAYACSEELLYELYSAMVR